MWIAEQTIDDYAVRKTARPDWELQKYLNKESRINRTHAKSKLAGKKGQSQRERGKILHDRLATRKLLPEQYSKSDRRLLGLHDRNKKASQLRNDKVVEKKAFADAPEVIQSLKSRTAKFGDVLRVLPNLFGEDLLLAKRFLEAVSAERRAAREVLKSRVAAGLSPVVHLSLTILSLVGVLLLMSGIEPNPGPPGDDTLCLNRSMELISDSVGCFRFINRKKCCKICGVRLLEEYEVPKSHEIAKFHTQYPSTAILIHPDVVPQNIEPRVVVSPKSIVSEASSASSPAASVACSPPPSVVSVSPPSSVCDKKEEKAKEEPKEEHVPFVGGIRTTSAVNNLAVGLLNKTVCIESTFTTLEIVCTSKSQDLRLPSSRAIKQSVGVYQMIEIVGVGHLASILLPLVRRFDAIANFMWLLMLALNFLLYLASRCAHYAAVALTHYVDEPIDSQEPWARRYNDAKFYYLRACHWPSAKLSQLNLWSESLGHDFGWTAWASDKILEFLTYGMRPIVIQALMFFAFLPFVGWLFSRLAGWVVGLFVVPKLTYSPTLVSELLNDTARSSTPSGVLTNLYASVRRHGNLPIDAGMIDSVRIGSVYVAYAVIVLQDFPAVGLFQQSL